MISTRIPFAGFYHSIWDQEMDNWLEQQADWYADNKDADRQTVWDQLFEATDFGAARLTIARAYAEAFGCWLADTLDITIEGEFDGLSSPRYYNFETDRVFAKMPESVFQTILDELRTKDAETLAKAFRDAFTSCSGFISFYDPVVPAKPIADWDHNELYVLLQAWIAHQDVDDIDYELFDGLHERVAAACDEACDWDKVGVATPD